MSDIDLRATTLYRFYGEGALLYVGIAGNPGRRFGEHEKDKEWWGIVKHTEMEHFVTRAEAKAAEQKAIQTEGPLYNVVHRDEEAVHLTRVLQWTKRNKDKLGFDPSITNFDWRLLWVLTSSLRFDEFRPLSQSELAERFGNHRQQMHRSLRRLVEHGYLVRKGRMYQIGEPQSVARSL